MKQREEVDKARAPCRHRHTLRDTLLLAVQDVLLGLLEVVCIDLHAALAKGHETSLSAGGLCW